MAETMPVLGLVV